MSATLFFLALLALDKNREKEVMKKSAYAHSALIQNTQFGARIVRKECGHFTEVGRSSISTLQKLKNIFLKSRVAEKFSASHKNFRSTMGF